MLALLTLMGCLQKLPQDLLAETPNHLPECSGPDFGGPFPALLGTEWQEVNYDGTYVATEDLTVWVIFCHSGGSFSAFNRGEEIPPQIKGNIFAAEVPSGTVIKAKDARYALVTR